MLVNLFMSSMVCIPAAHYGMILIPSFLYPACAFVNYILENYHKIKKSIFNVLALVLSIGLIVFFTKNLSSFVIGMSEGNKLDSDKEQVISMITENTENDDRILVIGFRCSYYVLSDRLSSSQFFYQNVNVHYPDGDKIMIDDINSNLPKVLIVENDKDFGKWFEHYDCYELVDIQHGVWLLKDEYTP